ncbi:Lysine-specific histone demethylase 1 homolog 3 (Flavin-containing amine oxidase domain-containing protein 3) (Protein LSD1-like 3) [Durusdinium trenchii]|uniref:Lysine-specific histone demethylase 1 homolog 3 (Flavin-containing amine oxidase domain-containing protein 3) (Protein LSD1-like 3) n=1 Tax=Durusdinium trenchii TaxID=1381693 RepID=A0ABP0SCA6_9DINO
MMALLHFYNMPTLRVGGNTDFEGDDEKHHFFADRFNDSLKAQAFRQYEEAKVLFERAAQIRKSDVSVRDAWATVLSKLPQRDAELLEWQLRVRSEQNWATQMDDVGLRLAELATYSDFDSSAPHHGGDFRFTSSVALSAWNTGMKAGKGELLAKLSEGLDLRLNTKVKSIHFEKDDRLMVQTDQTIYQGAAVIVTASLAVLQRHQIHFHPPMPSSFLAALGRFQMGQLGKLFVKFTPGQCPIGETTYLLSRLVSRTSRRLLYYCIREDVPSTVALVCLVGGPSYEAARQCTVHEVVQELKEMYPHMAPGAVEDVHFVSFEEDPHVLGSWTSGKVGSSSSDFDIFQQKNSRGLYFAGEHTCRLMYGSLQAAAVSGARAALQVISATDLSSAWPFFQKNLSSLCDELAPSSRQDLCGASCADTWQPLASQVPSYFQSWPGMGLKTRSCWEALGWTEVSWKAKSRIPTSSQKSWKQLSPEEQRSARCVGYSRQLWDDLKEDIADSILCRNGSAHFQLPWDCLPGPLMEDWRELGIERAVLDEAVPSPVAGKSFSDLSPKQRAAALRIGYREWLW